MMKALRYLFVLAAVAGAIPATIGVTDGWAWLLFGKTWSWVEWTALRAGSAAAFLWVAGWCALAAQRDAADR